MRWGATLAAGLLVSVPALAENCMGLGDTVLCMGEPAMTGSQMPAESKREDMSLLIPARIRPILEKADATGLRLGEPGCVALGDALCD